MKLQLKKKLIAKSGKVKSVDFHPNFTWILLGLYNGSISIYDYESQSSVQYLEITNFPIRSAKFMPEKNYIICGSDDKKIRVYNYNTMEKVKEFEAHNDFIRSIAIHLKEPLILSSSDDNTIHLYSADNFRLIREYEEHKDFVMKIAVNPKDVNMFASASMDKKIKIWSFNIPNSQLTLEGHKKGCGAVAFCPLGDKPYIASGGDDFLIKIWDYTTKQCLFTFNEHEGNISAVCFHNELPILITSAEDEKCNFYNISSGKLEDCKIFSYGIIWDIVSKIDDNVVGMGSDETTLVFQMGRTEPLATFNHHQAKIVYCLQNNIYALNLKQISHEVKDGEVILVPPKQLGSTELYPSNIEYSPNGRYFSVVSDKEFIISTSGVYRSSCVGTGSSLSWCPNDMFIVKEGTTVKIYSELKCTKSFKPGFSFYSVFGGPYIGVKTDSVYIYDIEYNIFIRKIDVLPDKIIWNDKCSQVALICSDATYILKVNKSGIDDYIERVSESGEKSEDGYDEAFEMLYDIGEKVQNGFFIDEVFVYQTTKNKINFAVNEKSFPITTLNGKYFLLGYIENTNRIYLINKNFNVISFAFPLSFVKYMEAILSKDFDKASALLKDIPETYNEKVISFLEKFGHIEICYMITKNLNQKFSLALKLKKLEDAFSMAEKENSPDKMKLVADLAIELGEFSYAEKAMSIANDFPGLLLYYTGIQDREKLSSLAQKAKDFGSYNIAFSCYYQLNEVDNCVGILLDTQKYPEASLFCRTYCPSKLNEVIEKWNNFIESENSNSRMITKVVNPIDEGNINEITQKENDILEFYLKVKNGNLDDMSSFNKFYNDEN